jgi:hypothetical protein
MQTSVAPTDQACAARWPTWSSDSVYASLSVRRWANAQKRQPV